MKNYDVVYHMAAMLGVKKTEKNSLDCLNININGTKNTLESCVFNKVKKIIFASSSEVYGEQIKILFLKNLIQKVKLYME